MSNRNISLQYEGIVLKKGPVYRVYRKSEAGHRLIARFMDQGGATIADFRETDSAEWAKKNLKGKSAADASSLFTSKMNENYRVLGYYEAVRFVPGDRLPVLERDEAEDLAEPA